MRLISLRQLHLWHRWLGILLGLLVLGWFISGLVMLYVPYPSLTQTERLAHLPPLDRKAVKVNVADQANTNSSLQPESVRLVMLHHRPAYFYMLDKQWQALWADSGERIVVDHALLSDAITAFMPKAHIKQIKPVNLDQWSLSTKYDGHRPLYLAQLDDEFGTRLYLSGKTGEVLIDTTRQERAWNWLGAVIHWIYFTPLRIHTEIWRQVILWTSFFSMVLVGIGCYLGIHRLRITHKYKNNRMTPYTGWKKWHHLMGLAGGVFCLTWLLSGWLSVKPFDWISDRKLSEQERIKWSGQPLTVRDIALPAQVHADIKSLQWIQFAGHTYLLGSHENKNRLVDPATGQPLKPFTQDLLLKQIKQVQPRYQIQSVSWLSNGDLYYRSTASNPAVPAVRVTFNDPHHTSYYINPNTAEIVASADDRSRLYRWLFHALHRFDFPRLIEIERLRQGLIIACSALGIVLTGAGLIIGIRRLNQARLGKRLLHFLRTHLKI